MTHKHGKNRGGHRPRNDQQPARRARRNPFTRESAWSAFEQFCVEEFGRSEPGPASGPEVARYLEQIVAGGASPGELRAHLRAISGRHLEAGHPNPVQDPAVLSVLAGALGVSVASDLEPDPSGTPPPSLEVPVEPGQRPSEGPERPMPAPKCPPQDVDSGNSLAVSSDLEDPAVFAAITTLSPSTLPSHRAHAESLPPILEGRGTPEVRHQVASFYSSVAEMLAAWIQRRSSPHTQRAYRRDLVAFIEFQGIRWPEDAHELLRVTVPDVQAYRDHLEHELGAAPKTINRRVSSLSGFYRYMREAAAEMHLPVVVPNPAHSQFISRENQDPVRPTEELSITQARRLMAMPEGESALAARDRAILKFYIYTGARIATGCRLLVEDLELSREDDPRIRIVEKGKGRSRRVIGVHFALAEALREYLAVAGITSGPVFRARKSARSQELGTRPMSMSSMYRALGGYLAALPGAMRKHELADGGEEDVCGYSPHTLRATTATMLLNEGVDIVDVQKLLGHKHVTTTQIYDKRRRATVESASHRLPV